MPIVLVRPEERRTLAVEGGASIEYAVPRGDDVLRASQRSVRAARREGVDQLDAFCDQEADLIARHVVNWTGVEDAAGVTVEWPAAGTAWQLGEKPDAAALATRRLYLSGLPPHVLQALGLALISRLQEGRASGKG